MNTHNPTPLQTSESDWHLLGELKIPVGINTNNIIQAWLTENLVTLNLSTNFFNRVLKSAQDSVTYALHPDSAETIEHIHLSVYIPHDEHISDGKTWGFFHIARIGSQMEDVTFPDHTIDFYLYVEGE